MMRGSREYLGEQLPTLSVALGAQMVDVLPLGATMLAEASGEWMLERSQSAPAPAMATGPASYLNSPAAIAMQEVSVIPRTAAAVVPMEAAMTRAARSLSRM